MPLPAREIMKLVDKVLAEMDAEEAAQTATSGSSTATVDQPTQGTKLSTDQVYDFCKPTLVNFKPEMWQDYPRQQYRFNDPDVDRVYRMRQAQRKEQLNAVLNGQSTTGVQGDPAGQSERQDTHQETQGTS